MARFNNLVTDTLCLYLITLSSSFAAQTNISATIADDIGCEIRLPVSVIFSPQRIALFQGAPAAHEIKPLRAELECANKTKQLEPKLSIEGQTPYETDSVFLSSEPNGVGFMLRLAEGDSPSLSEFYSPEKAIKRGIALPLSPLNSANQHQKEEVFWVGLVGPMQQDVRPGQFFSTLTFNVFFQ